MNEVPLVKDNEINSINTSIIAIKKQLNQISELLGLIDIPDAPDLSPYVKKADVADVIEADNMNPVTSNAVAVSNAMPVNEVTSGNMHSVTSGAVYSALNTIETYTSITGLTLYKIGHLVFGTYSRYLTTSNPFEAGTLPYAWRPKVNYQVALINSSNDILVGQLIVYSSNGKVTLWNGVETFSGSNYAASIAYVV